MSPRVFAGTGGGNKLFFLRDEALLAKFNITNNYTFTSFLQGLKSTLAICHMPQPSSPSEYDGANILAMDLEMDSGNELSVDVDVTVAESSIDVDITVAESSVDVDVTVAESSVDADVTVAKSSANADITVAKSKVDTGVKSHVKTYNKLMDALTDHELVLRTFWRALNQAEWPKHDHAEVQLMVVSNDMQTSMLSSSKRLRDIAEEDGVYVSLPSAKRSGPA